MVNAQRSHAMTVVANPAQLVCRIPHLSVNVTLYINDVGIVTRIIYLVMQHRMVIKYSFIIVAANGILLLVLNLADVYDYSPSHPIHHASSFGALSYHI
jgi:hypothetical protein